ncbi:MAG: helix-turn-helix transcriptional regulator [Acidobacteriota bacterium]|nr:helix-turn-helix transcriptional regulator [Acidobacteriota bacterium]
MDDSKPYRVDLIRQAMAGREPRLTTIDLAELAGQSRGTISKIVNGSPNVRFASLKAVAEALGLSLEELFTPKPEQAEAQHANL